MMNAVHWMGMVSIATIAAAGGAGAARWWCGRRAAELRVRLGRLEQARQVAVEHAAQARRQIERLQKDVAAQHKARAEARALRRRELNEALDAGDRGAPTLDATIGPSLPAHGFADTLPMVPDDRPLVRR